jgi:hypothetical protein
LCINQHKWLGAYNEKKVFKSGAHNRNKIAAPNPSRHVAKALANIPFPAIMLYTQISI